jgi:amino acid transporter
VSFGTGSSSSSILLLLVVSIAVAVAVAVVAVTMVRIRRRRRHSIVEAFLVFLVSLPQTLTGFIDGSFVRYGTPVPRRPALFQKPTSLLFHRLHNRLANEQLGVLGTSSVQRAIGADQAAVPFVTGMVIRHATATAENVLKRVNSNTCMYVSKSVSSIVELS